MSRQESFEKHYAEQHDVPAETMVQYRWVEQDGYRLPGISAAYRNYCAGWDAAGIESNGPEMIPVSLDIAYTTVKKIQVQP